MEKAYDEGRSKEKSIIKNVQTLEDSVRDSLNSYDFAIRLGKNALNAAKDLGAEDLIKKINATISDASVNKGEMEKIISKINSFII